MRRGGSVKKTPSDAFIRINRTDCEAVEIRTNWVNPAAIMQVIKQQRGNQISVRIIWITGASTKLEGETARLFLEQWGDNDLTPEEPAL